MQPAGACSAAGCTAHTTSWLCCTPQLKQLVACPHSRGGCCMQWHPSGEYLAVLPRGQTFAMVWNATKHEVARVDADVKVWQGEWCTPGKPRKLVSPSGGTYSRPECLEKKEGRSGPSQFNGYNKQRGGGVRAHAEQRTHTVRLSALH